MHQKTVATKVCNTRILSSLKICNAGGQVIQDFTLKDLERARNSLNDSQALCVCSPKSHSILIPSTPMCVGTQSWGKLNDGLEEQPGYKDDL